MAPDERENRRRTDPVLVIKQVLEAGFRFVDFIDLFFRPDDELRYEVGRRTVTGNTDRFSLLFQKPSGCGDPTLSCNLMPKKARWNGIIESSATMTIHH